VCVLAILLLFFTTPRQPRSTLFPYTTLFRSQSRTAVFRFRPLKPEAIREYVSRIAKAEKLKITDEGMEALVYVAEGDMRRARGRSEEHTSELQSRFDLVCRLLLEKKKKKINK